MEFAELLSTAQLPAGLPYELRNMALVYSGWLDDAGLESVDISGAIRADVLRLLSKKQPGSETVRKRIEPHLLIHLDADALDRLGRELLVARQIARAIHPDRTSAKTRTKEATR